MIVAAIAAVAPTFAARIEGKEYKPGDKAWVKVKNDPAYRLCTFVREDAPGTGPATFVFNCGGQEYKDSTGAPDAFSWAAAQVFNPGDAVLAEPEGGNDIYRCTVVRFTKNADEQRPGTYLLKCSGQELAVSEARVSPDEQARGGAWWRVPLRILIFIVFLLPAWKLCARVKALVIERLGTGPLASWLWRVICLAICAIFIWLYVGLMKLTDL